MEARLLIITPTLGRSATLHETVEGVRNLALSATHVLACPSSRIPDLQGRFPHCAVIADQGKASSLWGGLNAGLQKFGPDFEWFTYINDDDLLLPGFAQMFRLHTSRSQAAPIAYGDVELIDASGEFLARMTTEKNVDWFIPHLLAGITPVTQQGMIARTGIINQVGMFDPDYTLTADLLFWVQCLQQKLAFQYYPLRVARYRIQPDQLSRDVDLAGRERDRIVGRIQPTRSQRLRRRFARLRYRILNISRYLERYRNVGFASSKTLLSTSAGSRANRN